MVLSRVVPCVVSELLQVNVAGRDCGHRPATPPLSPLSRVREVSHSGLSDWDVHH